MQQPPGWPPNGGGGPPNPHGSGWPHQGHAQAPEPSYPQTQQPRFAPQQLQPGGAEPLDVNVKIGARLGCLGALMFVFVAPFIASGIYGLVEGELEGALRAFGFGVVSFIVFGLAPGVILLRKRVSVKRFDARGVTRFDGRTFPWSEFRSVQRTMQRSRGGGFAALFSAELVFQSGKASIYVRVVENFGEVNRVLDELEAGRNRWAG